MSACIGIIQLRIQQSGIKHLSTRFVYPGGTGLTGVFGDSTRSKKPPKFRGGFPAERTLDVRCTSRWPPDFPFGNELMCPEWMETSAEDKRHQKFSDVYVLEAWPGSNGPDFDVIWMDIRNMKNVNNEMERSTERDNRKSKMRYMLTV